MRANRRALLVSLGLLPLACGGAEESMSFHSWPGGQPSPVDYPETLANVVLWLDARWPKCVDLAGTTLAGYSAPVRRIDLRVPAGQYASAASDAARPLQENGALSFHVKDTMIAPAASSVPGNDLTYALGYSMRDAWIGCIFKHASAALFGYYFQTQNVAGRIVSVDYFWDWVGHSGMLGSPPTYHQIPPGEPVAAVVRISPTTVKVSVVVQGVRADFALTRSNPATPIAGPWQIAGEQTPCAIAQGLLVARAISDAENDALLDWLVANPGPTRFPTDLDLVVITGDSIARSRNVASRLDWWTTLMQESLCAERNINMLSIAQSGDPISLQLPNYAGIARPFYSRARAKNIMLNPIGLNNMRSQGQSAATALAEYYSYLDMQLADGFLPIACTVLPTTGGIDTEINAFNADVRASWASRCYADLADVASVSELSDAFDTAIYPDGLHPSAAGNALMAPVYAAAVQRVRN